MFKLVQWAYRKGIEHENQRIKKILIEFNAGVRQDVQVFGPPLRNGTDADLIARLHVKEEAMHLVNCLLNSQVEYLETTTMPAPIDEKDPNA